MDRNQSVSARFALERNVLVLGLSSTIATFSNTLWFFYLPLLFQGQGLGAVQIGIVYSLSVVVASLFAIPTGAFIDAQGRKRSIVLGSLVAALAVLLLANTTWPVFAASAFLLFSIGGVFSDLGRMTLISESVVAERLATGFGFWKTMAGSVAVIGPILGGLFVVDQRMRLILFASSLLLFLVFMLRALFLKETLTKRGPSSLLSHEHSMLVSSWRQLKLLFVNNALLTLSLAFALYNVLVSQTSFIIPLYAKNSLGLGSFEMGLMFGIFVLFDAFLAIPFGMIADKLGKAQTVMISWLGGVITMMAFAYSTDSVIALVLFSIWSFFGGLGGPALLALLGSVGKTEARGLSLGFFFTFALAFAIPAELVVGAMYSVSEKLPFIANLVIDSFAICLFAEFVRKSGPPQ
jgi:DHA1 family multidrug resistance protein-like MFS transporter